MIEFFNWLDTIPLWQFLLLMAGVFFVMMIITIIIYHIPGMFHKQRQLPPFVEEDEIGYW